MERIIKCINKRCYFSRPAKEDDWVYKTIFNKYIAISGKGRMIVCPICKHQTSIIEID